MDRARLDRLAAAGHLVALAGLGAAFAVVVPLGLPYDEPSHWQNALVVADTGQLPAVGDPGTSYEAVQGPLAYVAAGLLLSLVRLVGLDGDAAWVAVRVLQLAWLLAAYLLLVALLGRLLPETSVAARRVAGMTVLGTPALLAVGSSIQNDVPMLALCLAALLLLARALERDASQPAVQARDGALVGLLAGAAFLAKATVWPLGPVVVGALALRRRPVAAVAATLVGLLTTGWWVVRNLVLYGSLTGTDAVAAAGYDFPASGWSGPGSLVELGRGAVTFLWIPVEYWRNTVDAPTVVAVVVVAATVGLVVLGVRRGRPRSDLGAAVLALAVLSLLVWAVTTIAFTNASVRLAYPALVLWAVVVARALDRGRAVVVVTLGAVVVLDAWALLAV